MTVEVYPGPGTTSWQSTRFQATVNGTPAYVYGYTRTTSTLTVAWGFSTPVECSWLRFGADQTTEVRVVRIGVTITSYKVYPNTVGSRLEGGVLVLTVPPNTRLYVEVNGDRRHTMRVIVAPPKPSIPPGTVTYSGQLNCPVGVSIRFPAGVTTIGQLWKINTGGTVYLDAGAVVIGNFDIRGSQGVLITGPGVLAGTYTTPEFVQTLPTFAAKQLYSGVLGNNGVDFVYDNRCEHITFAVLPFYVSFLGIWSWRNVSAISPWYFEVGGFECSPRTFLNPVGETIDCYCEVADDCLYASPNYINQTIRGSFAVCNLNSCFHLAYWTEPNLGAGAGYSTLIENCEALHLGIADTGDLLGPYPVLGGTAILKSWLDGFEAESEWGRGDVVVRNLRVWGPHAARGIVLENRPYPFGVSAIREQYGQNRNWTFENVTFEFAPAQKGRLVGRDVRNGPRDINFSGVSFGGVAMTTSNIGEFFDLVHYQNIFVEGRPLVTAEQLCNQALSHIGAASIVTSLNPPDASREAELCASFFGSAATHLLELHNWSFATRRAPLVPVTGEEQKPWAYCYELPAGMLRLLGLTQNGTTDDYESQEPIGRYEMIANDDGVERIYSDVPDAVARFTVYQLDVGRWPPLFQNAFTWHLAGLLAGPIIKGEQGAVEAKRCAQMANGFLSRAAASNANQRAVASQQDNPPDWIAARAVNRNRFTGRIVR